LETRKPRLNEIVMNVVVKTYECPYCGRIYYGDDWIANKELVFISDIDKDKAIKQCWRHIRYTHG